MTRHNDFKSPTIIGLDYNIENKAALSVVEKLKTELQNLNNNFNSLFFEDFVSSQRSYKISAKYDPYSFATADIPYTEEYFTFLGTVVARRIHSILSQTLSKVIVVDCDNTLWEGICGEGSLEEVRVLEKNIILQKFLLEQYAKGIILCLCSKNNENDVFKVFNTNQNMLVNLNHFITWRINWKRKSDNLLSLAEELNLGMDSFIFIDDSPIECAEVFSSLPQVMTFQFFDNIDELKYLLKNIWTLDKNRVGKEDKYRTEMYRQNIQRNKLKTAVTSFNSFIEDLQVHTQILSADIDYIPRIIQMLARINQFNLTLKKYSIPELQKLINSKDHFCYVINVSDKFGDYGTVGVLILKREGKRLTLDTFLISCRALGRGIEATMLYHAAKIAIQNNCHEIALYGVPSGRNIPALNFFNIIRKLSNDIKKEENLLIFTPQALLNIDLMIDYNNDLDSTKKQSIEITNIKRNPLIIEPNKVFNFIAKESFNIMNVVAEIHRQKIVSRSNLTSIYVKPRTHLEKQLVKVWEDVLKVKNIGINDNFFELGGHSLLATTIAGQLKKILGIEIPLSDMFNLLTVKELANHIESSMHKNTDSINSAFIIDSVAKKNFIIE
jgi:acyl carrier protein